MTNQTDLPTHLTIEELPDPFILTDEKGLVIQTNSRARKLFRLPEDTRQESIQQLLTIDPELFTKTLSLAPGEGFSFEDILRYKHNGEWRIHLRVHRHAAGNTISWYLIDFSTEGNDRQQMIDFMTELHHANVTLKNFSTTIAIYERVVNRLSQGLIITGRDGKVHVINDFARRLLGWTEADSRSTQLLERFTFTGDLPLENLLSDSLTSEVTAAGEVVVRCPVSQAETRCYLQLFSLGEAASQEHNLVWNLLETTRENEAQQRLIDFSAELADLNRELVKRNSEVLELSRRDSLTGLFNRGYILNLLQDHLADPTIPSIGLILIDADNFKGINDSFGHEAGDVVLQFLSQNMEKIIGSKGKVGRYGGEEFLILLPGLDASASTPLAEKIRSTLESTELQIQEGSIRATLSAGITHLTHGEPLEKGLRGADKALYAAKDQGRNRCVVDG